MTVETSAIELRSSPHLKTETTTDQIMRNVVYALVPVSVVAVYTFGLSALALILVTTATCVLTEHLVCRFNNEPTTVTDWSAAITGMLLGLTLPPGFPLWMGFVGGVIAILLGKALFGGLGYNKFNPALVARAFLQAAFPVAITTWTPPFVPARFAQFIPSSLTPPFLTPALMAERTAEYVNQVDGWSGATPLSLMKFDDIGTGTGELMAGMIAGSAGETCSIVILLGGIYLAARGMMNWRIPVAILLSVFVFSGIFHMAAPDTYPTPFFMLFSGGLMLGAVFMATDMVASPTTNLGVWIYGSLMGFITVIIRLLGGLPEGVMYAILLGNAVSWHIEQYTQPNVFGAKNQAKEAQS